MKIRMRIVDTEDHVVVDSPSDLLYFLSKFSYKRYERNMSKTRLDKF